MKKITLFTLAFLVNLAFIYAQNIITVDNSPGSAAQFNDLQTAISNASSGDIIYVHPSETNYGNIEIDKPLTMIGFSHSSADKQTLITDLTLTSNASNVRVSGFRVTDDLFITAGTPISDLILENNYFSSSMVINNGGVNNLVLRGNVINTMGSGASSGSSFSNALITNNVFFGNLTVRLHESVTIKNNVFLTSEVFNSRDETGNVTVQNSIFIARTSGTANANNDGVTFENCLIYNQFTGNADALVGTGNIVNVDPLFVEDNDNAIYEPLIDNYNLQSGSQAISTGVSGEDLGLFDGSGFVFDNVGFTDGIPTINIQAISTTVAPGQNLNVIINTTNQ
ncbi:hypothetical protein L0P88_05400 [Muricauda sp. SCSIO 64092]|uniref:hypothetical protein n=1 Tax=Allomuricauda sp. SCSIO 64092 TaxID=2908842 RepID=UPI001FF1C0E4|nr:hypothetical protein [Muricauda sp. SCSIO 64092]UOY07987.1 hypothetical protein L0P88_05400 [Muricauda sp. SCSIO 64092]